MASLVSGLGGSLGRALTGRNLAFPALAVLATIALVASGIDRRAHDFLLEHNPVDQDRLRATYFWIGMVYPIVLGVLLLGRGLVTRSDPGRAEGWAVIQAVLVVGLLTFVLKVATGRPQPLDTSDPAEFHLLRFDFSHGYFHGHFHWPSGHTSGAVAAAAALAAFHRSRAWITGAAFAAAALVAASMLYGSFHWVSDVVAGALVAYPLGREIGRTFLARTGAAASR
jgi:membrane-associated phospholipid phosphatase